MNIPQYVTITEVQRVCKELGIRDWTNLSELRVTLEEAKIIQELVGGEARMIAVEDFRQGLEVELEHGTQFPDANVTNNHPILTGMIVLAHLKEMLDYYARLLVAELEGDLWKAFKAGDEKKVVRKYQMLLKARQDLSQRENASS